MTSGLYVIRNSVSGSFYVGSSRKVEARLVNHRSMLRRGRHDNIHLQRAFNCYGEGAFSFELIAIINPTDVLATEQRFLDKCVGKPNCYNIAPSVVCGTAGRKMSAEYCARISERQKGRPGHPVSPEARAKIGAANRGKPNAWKGKTRSAESRAKMSDWQKGRILTEEHRQKVRVANIGKRASIETRAKMSATRTGMVRRSVSEEGRANISASKSGANNPNFGKSRSAETRAKISATKRARKADRRAA